jgi:hypothetical protein
MTAKQITIAHTTSPVAAAATPIAFPGSEVGRKVYISTSGVLGTGGIPTVEYRNREADAWVTNVAGSANVHFGAEVTLKGVYNQIKIASSVADTTIVTVAISPSTQYGLTGEVDPTLR